MNQNQVTNSVDKNKASKKDQFPENWVNPETRRFIESLSFDGYVLAGNSITNMVQGIPLQGDLDFWASSWKKFEAALEEIGKYYQHFSLYPSMVEMFNNDGSLPRINLVFTDLTPNMTIERFDFDYCRCLWVPNTRVVFGHGAKECIETKIISRPNYRNSAMSKRILKAITYGYTFQRKFWVNHSQLLAFPQMKLKNGYNSTSPFPVRIEDLNLKKFRLREVDLKVTDMSNIQNTLDELEKQFTSLALSTNVKLPILLKFEKQDFKLLLQYAKQIIKLNPLSDAHYNSIKIGTKILYRDYYDEESYHNSSGEGSIDDIELMEDAQEKKIGVKTILVDNEQRTIYLNEDQSSYLEISQLPEELEKIAIQTFDQMWKLHPPQKHKIIMFEKEIEVSRYSQSYLDTPTDLSHTVCRSYMYSGFDTSQNNQELPSEFRPFFEYIQKIDPKYNQVIVNWYQDANDYIAYHSDCQIGMIPDAKVCLLSVYPTLNKEEYRTLAIVPKQGTQSISEKCLIQLSHGSIVTMCGRTQDQFKHGVEKESHETMPRISISFRQMASTGKNEKNIKC